MTDEEIEKALKDLTSIDLSDESNYDSCCRIIPPRGMSVIYEAINYINRLKEKLYQTEQRLAECEVGYQGTLDLERRLRADDKEQIRKDTAKDILEELYSAREFEPLYDCDTGGYIRLKEIKEIANKYGIEVDDE